MRKTDKTKVVKEKEELKEEEMFFYSSILALNNSTTSLWRPCSLIYCQKIFLFNSSMVTVSKNQSLLSFTHVCIWLYIYIYIYKCVCMCMCVCVCLHVHEYINIYIYIIHYIAKAESMLHISILLIFILKVLSFHD